MTTSSPRNGGAKDSAPVDIIEAVAIAKGTPLESFKKYGAKAAKRGKLPVARVPAYNEAGEPFSQFDLVRDGKGWFKAGKGMAGLFFPGRNPKADETWLMVEGVKDAAALNALGYNACGPNKSDLATKYASLFRGCSLIIVHDLDTAGVTGAEKSARQTFDIAGSLKVARLPGEIQESGGSDVRDDAHGIGWFEKPPELFGWLATRVVKVSWRTGTSCVGRGDLLAELQRTAPRYQSVETLQHEPSIAGHYYTCGPIQPGNGKSLLKLLDRFEPAEDTQYVLHNVAVDGGVGPFLVFIIPNEGKLRSPMDVTRSMSHDFEWSQK